MEDFNRYRPLSSEFPFPHNKRYDVFLSFRGPEVRKTLVDHLFQSLSTAGLHVFLDSEKLEKGENIGISLEQAIQDSAVYIPIFSTNYADSAWCLKELALMWDSKSISRDTQLIPLFYNVEPSDVRYPEKRGSPYAEAFLKHFTQRRHRRDDILGWKKAMYEVSCLSGWSLKETASGYEGRLVKQVVSDVLNTLKASCLDVPKHLVGLKGQMEKIIKVLKLNEGGDDRLSIGICGMGGLGKTTLSKALYNDIHRGFEAFSFVSNVGATKRESTNGLVCLQQQILRDLVKIGHLQFNSVDQGTIQMRNHLRSVRALVILDDVDDVEQLDALLGDWYGAGSRIIITSRDERVLKLGRVDKVYPMKGLKRDEAVELFSWHAFMRSRPEEGYEDMTERIVKSCGGMPLSLEIIGTHLHKRSLTCWSEALEKFRTIGHQKIYKPLKISYDALPDPEKQVFLDIACFFIQLKYNFFYGMRAYNMDFYVKFWRAVGLRAISTSLEILKEKSLITVQGHKNGNEDEDEDTDYQVDGYYNIFSMHDHIKDMGRKIDEEESGSDSGQVRRIWREEHLLNVMATTQEMPNIQGLMWKRHMKLDHIDSLAFMSNLKFLFWWNLHLKMEIKMLPSSLRYLVLCNCELKNQQLYLQTSSHSDSWAFPHVLLRCLPFLKTQTSNKSKDSCGFSHVLPKSISQLRHLRYLDMSGTHQTCLPEEFGNLRQLEELYLVRCSLKALPQSFGDLVSLKNLDLSRNLLLTFPASFQHLKSLVHLEAAENRELVQLFGLPKGLVKLNLRKCSKLGCVSTMSTMQRLKTVDLSHCKSLTQLPLLRFTKSLRTLKVGGCKELVELPALPEDLVSLDSWGCSQLQIVFGKRWAFEDHSAVFEGFAGEGLQMATQVNGVAEGIGNGLSKVQVLRMPKQELRMPNQLQRICMIDCDVSEIDIWRMLEECPYLEQLEVSITLPKVSKEFQRRDHSLVDRMNIEVPKDTNCQAVFICFVLCGDQNVCLPKIQLETSIRNRGGDPNNLPVKIFNLPSFSIENCSEKDILRICVYRKNGGKIKFDKGDIISCSYTLQTSPQGGNPLRHANISFLPQNPYGFSYYYGIENVLLWPLKGAQDPLVGGDPLLRACRDYFC